ncbi:unnamed protein product [Polarella glacialis]|uniref:Uncharacterized protein n=1 Tax=Polarella glacialis TaxID=89957 RepID=A0A813IT49_POLGL|nr:unnamed protein product [Polarella glacialis]
MTLSMYQEAYCPSLHKHYEDCSTGMRDPRTTFCTRVTGCHQKLDSLSLFCPMPGLQGEALDVGSGPPNSSPKGREVLSCLLSITPLKCSPMGKEVSFFEQEICGSTPCAKAIADHSDLCATHPILMSEPMTLSMYQKAYCPGLHKHYEHCSTRKRDPRTWCTRAIGCRQKLDSLWLLCPMPNLPREVGLKTTANNNNYYYNFDNVCGPSCTLAPHEISTDCDLFDEVNTAVDGVIAYQDSVGCRARTSEHFSNRQRGAVLLSFNHSIEVFSNGQRGSDLPPYNQSLQSMAFPALMLLLALCVAAYSLCGRLVRQRHPLALCQKEEDEEDHKELLCQSESA